MTNSVPDQLLAEGLTEDRLLDGRVALLQPPTGYRAAIDPVFLAAAVPVQSGERVLDVGCGVAAAALCLAVRVPDSQIIGLDCQPELAALALRNVLLNDLDGRVTALVGDLLSPPAALKPGSFDHVMTNPPFSEDGTPSPHAGKDLANREGAADLRAWMGFCVSMLRHKGTLSVVHRADRIDDLLAALHGRVGGAEIIPLWPKAGRPAKRVVLRARKGVRSPAILSPGLVLHQDDGRYTPEAEAILRGAAALG